MRQIKTSLDDGKGFMESKTGKRLAMEANAINIRDVLRKRARSHIREDENCNQ